MDRKKSLLNVSISVIFRVITLFVSLLAKRFLIRYCGNEVNGLNALYLNIIGVLSVAELGVGSAITFCMYKPIVEGNKKQVNALFCLFRRVYFLIATTILIAGVIITPFIHVFAKDYAELNVNFYTTFILMLMSVVLTYLFCAEISLINAYKNNYITTTISSGGLILQYILQIVVLIIWKKYEIYLICRIVAVIIQWIATHLVINKDYKQVVRGKNKIDNKTRDSLSRSIRAMFMHKVGNVLVNSVDGIIIASFVGVVMLGEYSNYNTVILALAGVINLVFTSLISVIGHMYVKSDIQTSMRYCEAMHYLNFFLGVVFYLGYYAVIDDLVTLLFGEQLIISLELKLVITINGFVQFLRKSVMLFRDATGTFYYDRWKPVYEGIVNVILSIIFIHLIGVSGVLVATILTNLLICHTVEPYVLFKKAFHCSPAEYYRRNYGMIILFFGVLLLFESLHVTNSNTFLHLVLSGSLSIALSVILCSLVFILDKKSRKAIFLIIDKRS